LKAQFVYHTDVKSKTVCLHLWERAERKKHFIWLVCINQADFSGERKTATTTERQNPNKDFTFEGERKEKRKKLRVSRIFFFKAPIRQALETIFFRKIFLSVLFCDFWVETVNLAYFFI
jgi:hypothetical protein